MKNNIDISTENGLLLIEDSNNIIEFINEDIDNIIKILNGEYNIYESDELIIEKLHNSILFTSDHELQIEITEDDFTELTTTLLNLKPLVNIHNIVYNNTYTFKLS